MGVTIMIVVAPAPDECVGSKLDDVEILEKYAACVAT